MTNLHFPARAIGLAAATCLLTTPVAYAKMAKFKADLKGATEVPATDSMGAGTADVTVDTKAKKLSWKVKYQGLTGEPTAAHFHGPAKAGENAPPVVDISGNIEQGSNDITDAQWAELKKGRWYINIHTEKFPDGEIRGQVVKAK